MTLTLLCLMALSVLWPADAAAQRRVGRRTYVRTAVVVGSPFYSYDPFFWGWPGYAGFGWGWGYPWGYPPPYYWQSRIYDRTGAARLKVKPAQAQIYVDGYYVGVADDFDGTFQRLHVEAGEHQLAFYLDGYRTFRQNVLFRRDGTLEISHVMQPLGPGETSDKPVPSAAPSRPDGRAEPPDGRGPRPGGRVPPDARGARDSFGTLAIRVQPAAAEIYIDGERWDAPEGDRLMVELADGPHRVEIRKEGYRSYTANVRIRRGQTETLNVSLSQRF